MFYWLNESQAREFKAALTAIQKVYGRLFANDMMIALEKNMGFFEDQAFMSALDSEPRNEQEKSLTWRLHVLCWCASNAMHLAGDFVECGVFRGFSTSVLARYLRFEACAKRWYLYDTFSGIPEDQLDPGHFNPDGYLDPSLYDFVRKRFEAYPNISVIRGRVPEVLADSSPRRIAFLHLDMNSAKAELGALEVLFERLVTGAFIVLDDYGWFVNRPQKLVEDDFFRLHGHSVLELPTGQGLVIKRGAVEPLPSLAYD